MLVSLICRKCNATITGVFDSNEAAQAEHDAQAHPTAETRSTQNKQRIEKHREQVKARREKLKN